MASSILTGDRRLATSRKSGMTVLGKVPKPINLPSQRLENHGLDPNVEIVPKGTLTWGSRPSSGTPLAWGSSSSSPKTDGSAASPSCVNGRPSSGGSGTRPSTAGSDKSFEHVGNAWALNSRPSSASGISASNHILVGASRPRSAETRPGSSQLSRFAEPIPENSIPWGPARASERPGSGSLRANEFTLKSGEFPTLGSEKNSDLNSPQGHTSDRNPPSVYGSMLAEDKRLEISQANDRVDTRSEKGNINVWKIGNPPYITSGPPSDTGNSQQDCFKGQQYPYFNAPPNQFQTWHNPPPGNPTDGVWYGGVPTAGPFRPQMSSPGSYPYYSSHIPSGPLPSSQIATTPGVVLGGYPHKNSETFHPHMSSVPAAPIISVRPGVYPHPVPYDGHYGLAPSSHNSAERESAFTGMTAEHDMYYQYSKQSGPQNPGNLHSNPGEHARTVINEQMEGGQYRVLLKQHDGCKNADGKRIHSVKHDAHGLETSNQQPEVGERDRGLKVSGNKETKLMKPEVSEGSLCPPVNVMEVCCQASCAAKLPEVSVTTGTVGDCQMKKHETAAILDIQQNLTKKNTTLLEKIEGLNNKARIADGRSEGHLKYEKPTSTKSRSNKADQSTKLMEPQTLSTDEVTIVGTLLTGTTTVPCNEFQTFKRGNFLESAGAKGLLQPSEVVDFVGSTVASPTVGSKVNIQRGTSRNQPRPDNFAKSRHKDQNDECWQTQQPRQDTTSVTVMTREETSSQVKDESYSAPHEHLNQLDLQVRNEIGDEACALLSSDSADYNHHRAKMKEIAAQRARQLQKEEEERTKEQKAKALAKLEELNRRTLTESSSKNSPAQGKNDASIGNPHPVSDAITERCVGDAIGLSGQNVVRNASSTAKRGGSIMKETNVTGLRQHEDSTVMSTTDSGCSKHLRGSNLKQGSDSETQTPDQSIHSYVDLATEISNAVSSKTVSGQLVSHDPSHMKQGQMGHRRKQYVLPEKMSCQKGTPVVTEATRLSPEAVEGNVSMTYGTASDLNVVVDHSLPYKRRNSRSIKNKNTHDEALEPQEGHLATPPESAISSPGLMSEAVSTTCISVEVTRNLVVGKGLLSTPVVQSQATEDDHTKVINQWKPHPPRRPARNAQARQADKTHGTETVVWAPVRTMIKNESAELAESAAGESRHPSAKFGNNSRSSLKSKRAEMERYVPKSSSTEPSQHVTPKQSSSSYEVATEDTITNSDLGNSCNSTEGGPAVTRSEVTARSRHSDHVKFRRNGKSQASWRQLNPSFIHNDGSSSSDGTKTVQNSSDQMFLSKNENSSGLNQANNICESNEGNCTVVLPEQKGTGVPNESVVMSMVEKGVMGSGKRQMYKVHKVARTSDLPNDAKCLSTGTAEISNAQYAVSGSNDSDGQSSLRTEIQHVGEQSKSHWLPKSQAHPSLTQHESGKSDKEFHARVSNDQHGRKVKDTSSMVQETLVGDLLKASHYEPRREKKATTGLPKGKSNISSQNVSHMTEQDLKPEHRHGKSPSRASHQRGHFHGRYSNDHETNEKCQFSGGQEINHRANQNFDQDNTNHRSQVKYHMVESHVKSNDWHKQDMPVADVPKESSRRTGPRYIEKGQNQSRKGSHYNMRSNDPTTQASDTVGSGD